MWGKFLSVDSEKDETCYPFVSSCCGLIKPQRGLMNSKAGETAERLRKKLIQGENSRVRRFLIEKGREAWIFHHRFIILKDSMSGIDKLCV